MRLMSGCDQRFESWGSNCESSVQEAVLNPREMCPMGLRFAWKKLSFHLSMRFAGPIARFQIVEQLCFRRSGQGTLVVSPAHLRRQAHEDRLDASPGFEAKRSLTVVEQIKLHVAPTSKELPLALRFGVRIVPAPFEDGTVSGKKMIASVPDKRERLVKALVEIIEEDSADAAGLSAMRQIEILVAPILKTRIVGDRMALTDLLPCAVKVNYIFATGVERCQIGSASEPRYSLVAATFGDLAKIRVNRRNIRIARMQNERNPCRAEQSTLPWRFRALFGKRPVHLRKVDAGLFEHASMLQDACNSTSATWMLPGILVKAAATRRRFFDLFQGFANAVLQSAKIGCSLGVQSV